MNRKTKMSDNLKNMNEELNNRDKASLCQINVKSIYTPPSIHLLGEVLKITTGVGTGSEFDVFAPHAADSS